MWLNTWQYTRQSPTTKTYPAQNIDSLTSEISCIKAVCVFMLEPISPPLFSDATMILNLVFTVVLFLNILSHVNVSLIAL